MTNTQKRIASALVLVLIVGLSIFLGTKATLGLLMVVGAICIDELYCNFFKSSRKSPFYLLAQALFIAPFAYFNFLEEAPHLFSIFVNAGVVLNFLLLIYLFYIDMDSSFVTKLFGKFTFASSALILFPLMSMASLFHYTEWISLVVVLLVVNFGMDTGAWFFGKNFGKNKLWPKVSPNKTIEGLVGGSLTSGVVGGIFYQILFGKMSVQLFFFFVFLGVMSQVGDLIQSKLKRQCDIKDSSNLIPGHGGVYDRIDSLIFLTPFFATAIKYFYFG
jgi:phosphatidate cytidylyltransferase